MEEYCKNITYGMAGKWFYCLSELKDCEGGVYYCLYKIDECPASLHSDDIQKFIHERVNQGGSLVDNWDGVMADLVKLFACGEMSKMHRRRLSAEELAEYNFQYLCEFLNTDLAVFVYDNGEYTLESFNYYKKDHDKILKRTSNLKEISDTFTNILFLTN